MRILIGNFSTEIYFMKGYDENSDNFRNKAGNY